MHHLTFLERRFVGVSHQRSVELHNLQQSMPLLFRLSLVDESRNQSYSPLSNIIAYCEAVGKDTELPELRKVLPEVGGNGQPVLRPCQVNQVKNDPGRRSDQVRHVWHITTRQGNIGEDRLASINHFSVQTVRLCVR